MPVQVTYQSDQTTNFTSNVSITGRVSLGSNMSSTGNHSVAKILTPSGTALAPTQAFTSEVSLGFYRSAASQMALSYGQFLPGDGTATAPAWTFTSDASRGFYRSAASTIAVTSGVTIDWFTNTPIWSFGTSANASGMTTGNLRLVFAASGISLMYSSGRSSYIIAGSSTSGAQA